MDHHTVIVRKPGEPELHFHVESAIDAMLLPYQLVRDLEDVTMDQIEVVKGNTEKADKENNDQQ